MPRKMEIPCNGKDVTYRVTDCKSEAAYISVERIESAPLTFQEAWSTQHSHDFYFLMWFFNGSGTDVIDFKEYSIEANKVFFLSPGQLHQIRDLCDFNGIVVTFSADFLNNANREVNRIIHQQVFSLFFGSLSNVQDFRPRHCLFQRRYQK